MIPSRQPFCLCKVRVISASFFHFLAIAVHLAQFSTLQLQACSEDVAGTSGSLVEVEFALILVWLGVFGSVLEVLVGL